MVIRGGVFVTANLFASIVVGVVVARVVAVVATGVGGVVVGVFVCGRVDGQRARTTTTIVVIVIKASSSEQRQVQVLARGFRHLLCCSSQVIRVRLGQYIDCNRVHITTACG